MVKPRSSASALVDAIDPHSAEPLYQQIALSLARDISSGKLAQGARIPSEAELMTRHGVSRVTVRQAVQLLVRNGQVVSRRGKGSYVSRAEVQHDLNLLQGFQDSLRNQGIDPETTLLEFSDSAGRIDSSLPQGLDLPVRLRRLYRVGGSPLAVVEGYLPASAAQLGEQRARHLPVYDILQQFLGLRIARADVEIRCEPPGAQVARELGLPASANALVMHRTSYTLPGVPCEYMRIHIVPERYTFKLSLPGPLEIVRSLVPAQRSAGAAQGSRSPRAAATPRTNRAR